MSNIVGIDLGTTYSAISRIDETGRPTLVSNSEGGSITPSIVAFENESNVIVGIVAMQNYGVDKNTFGRFKREMGTDKKYEAFGKTYNPTTLSSLVLKKLKDDTEKSIGEITEAVVTIPANFANEAREATLAAAKVAGLKIKNIINEPTAAALYYAFTSGDNLNGVYAVYDLGGGTFDISIIRVNGSDIEVINSEGVNRLGGDDFDEKLIEIVCNKFKDQTGEELDAIDFTKKEAEEQKKILGSKEKTQISITSPKSRERIEITRAELEDAISTLIAQAEMTCENVLDASNLTPNDINEVILVGGSTRMPVVQQSVEKVFKRAPKIFGNPDEAVTLGAALYAAYKTDSSNLNPLQKKAVEKVNISDVATMYYGTLVLDWDNETQKHNEVNDALIKKGAKLPCSITKDYQTIADNQTAVNCVVTESSVEETDPSFVKKIGEVNLKLPSGRPAGQKIEVTFSYDDNQIMKCSFLDVSSQMKEEIDVTIDNENIKQEIDIDIFKVE